MSGFNHSVKVPKLYKCAAKICREVAGGGGSIKRLVYEKKHFNTKALYALVVTTLQKNNEIKLLLKRTKLLKNEARLDPWLARVFISELIWGKKKLPTCEAKPIQTILAYEQAFKAHLSDTSADKLPEQSIRKKPRYVRINTLLTQLNEAIELFQEEGWTLQRTQDTYDSFLDQLSKLEGDLFLRDYHIPELLVFPAGTEFFRHPGYKKGVIVLQDKASCIPVHILSPPPGSVVLDMCAAPGMKTTQLATILRNEGMVYAVERDPKRFEVLNKMVEGSGAACIKTINKDVLECNNSDFPGVEYILVDPSCSGSGITERLDMVKTQDNSRLTKLTGFQIKILRSALTRYPQVKRVVYSTCSLYPEENEDVVRQVLETNNNFKLVSADNFTGKNWKNFGIPDFGGIGKRCIYTRPEEDLTNGFFVAVFERLQEGEDNEFFNRRIFAFKKNLEQKQIKKEKKYKQKVEKNAIEMQYKENVNESSLIDNTEELKYIERKNIETNDENNAEKKHKKVKKKITEEYANEDFIKKVKKAKKKNKSLEESEQELCVSAESVKRKKHKKLQDNEDQFVENSDKKSKRTKGDNFCEHKTNNTESVNTGNLETIDINFTEVKDFNEQIKTIKKKRKVKELIDNDQTIGEITNYCENNEDSKNVYKKQKRKKNQLNFEENCQLENIELGENFKKNKNKLNHPEEPQIKINETQKTKKHKNKKSEKSS